MYKVNSDDYSYQSPKGVWHTAQKGDTVGDHVNAAFYAFHGYISAKRERKPKSEHRETSRDEPQEAVSEALEPPQ